MKSFWLGILVLVLLGFVVVGSLFVSYNNREIELRNQAIAQQKSNETTFDQVWKIIQQQAGVAEEYKTVFKEIYPQLMEGRYNNPRGGALLSLIQESNPNFDTSLYKKLMTAIEEQRIQFNRAQMTLLDIKREHNNMRKTFPSNLFVGNRPELNIQIVTSSKTEDTFKTGKEDNIKLK